MNNINIPTDLVVVKRSGQRVDFNAFKIAVAIRKTFEKYIDKYSSTEVNKVYEDVLNIIYSDYKDRKTINVEDIQDIIEQTLLNNKMNDVYELFSEYRKKRSELRNSSLLKNQHKFTKAVDKIESIYDEKENPQEMLLKYGKVISQEYNKSYILENKYVKSCSEGKIYIHNLIYNGLGFFQKVSVNSLKFVGNVLFNFINLFNLIEYDVKGEVLIDNFLELINIEYSNKFKDTLIKNLYKSLSTNGFIEVINFDKLEERINKDKFNDIKYSNYEDLLKGNVLKNIFESNYNFSVDETSSYIKDLIKSVLTVLNSDAYKNKYTFEVRKNSEKIFNIFNEVLTELNLKTNVSFVYYLNLAYKPYDYLMLGTLIKNGVNVILSNADEEVYSNGYVSGINLYSGLSDNNRLVIANTSLNLTRISSYDKKTFYENLDSLLDYTKNQLISLFDKYSDKEKEKYKILFSGINYDDEKLDFGQRIRKVIKNGNLNINLCGLYECAKKLNEDLEISIKELAVYINNRIMQMSDETKLNFTLSHVNEETAVDSFKIIDSIIFGNQNILKDIYEASNLNEFNRVVEYSKFFSGGFEINYLIDEFESNKIAKIIESMSKIGFKSVSIRRKN